MLLRKTLLPEEDAPGRVRRGQEHIWMHRDECYRLFSISATDPRGAVLPQHQPRERHPLGTEPNVPAERELLLSWPPFARPGPGFVYFETC
eukprot:1118763-Pyramimonas_sp.AAC.1